ncbi:MAG: DUF3575 domain-containing protein [Pseudobdellovibrio sp.]
MKTQTKNLLLASILFLSIGNKAFADNHNLSSNPIASTLGFSNLEYSYKIADQLTLGLSGTSGLMKINDVEVKNSSFGIIGRFYFQPAFQNNSWYLVATASKLNYEASIISSGTKYTGKLEESPVAAGAGYHWFWKSFNMNLAGLISNQSKIELKDAAGNKYKDDVNATLSFEYNIGWKF